MLRVLGDGVLSAKVTSPCHIGPVSSRVLKWCRRPLDSGSATACVLEVGSLDDRRAGVEFDMAGFSSGHRSSVLYAMRGESPGDKVCLGGGDTRSHGAYVGQLAALTGH